MDETRYHYVSLDSDHDLTGDTLDVSLDQVSWSAAEPVTAPASAAGLPAPTAGFTRYWWRVLVGPGQPLDPTAAPEPLTLHGRLADTPETLFPSWVLDSHEADAPPALTDECWPVVVPSPRLAEWEGYPADVQAYAEASAVSTLRALTAYQVGGCPVVVMPCRSACWAADTWQTYEVAAGPAVGRRAVYPVLDSGRWYNTGCGGGCFAGCTDRDCVRLPGFPSEVTQVRVDGVTRPPETYYLSGRHLYTADGSPWPDRGVEVTYYPNPRPDRLGAVAAGSLAVEYAKAAAGGACRLPARATSVARANVNVELASPKDLFVDGLTGVPEADLYIRRVNPHRFTTMPSVWSPDRARR